MKIGFTIVVCMFIALITLLAVLAFKNKSANGELFHEFDVNEPAPVRATNSRTYATATATLTVPPPADWGVNFFAYTNRVWIRFPNNSCIFRVTDAEWTQLTNLYRRNLTTQSVTFYSSENP